MSVFTVIGISQIVDVLIPFIIPHFLNYPLLTQKYSDFVLWSKVVNIISIKENLTTAGFNTILTYYFNLNYQSKVKSK